MGKKVKVVKTKDGNNVRFQDKVTKESMTKKQFVKEIEKGTYEDYHVRVINKVKTPVSNPDKSSKNNLG